MPVCPYCDVRIPLPPALRLVKTTALLLALAGLLLLWIAATRMQASTIRIADITPAMNHARVQVEGRVTGTPRSGKEPGSLGFFIDDDSGRLRIFASAALAPANAPAAGNRVIATGNLKVTAGSAPVLFIRAPGDIAIITGEAHTP